MYGNIFHDVTTKAVKVAKAVVIIAFIAGAIVGGILLF